MTDYSSSDSSSERSPRSAPSLAQLDVRTGASVASGESLEDELRGLMAAPPSSNTGALTALGVQTEGDSIAFVDWLGFTVPAEDGVNMTRRVEALQAALGGHWSPGDHGFKGYRYTARSGRMLMAWGGQPGMGVHVELVGGGCRDLELVGNFVSWQAFFRQLLRVPGVKISRLDVAIDDKVFALSMEEVEQALTGGLLVTRFRKWKRDEGHRSIATGEAEGLTLYIGTKKTDSMVRVYDKAAQMKEDRHWIRFEAQFRNERAGLMANALAAGGLGRFRSWLAAQMEFKLPGVQAQRERWPVAPWWTSFLGMVEKLRLTTASKRASVADLRAWVEKQVAPALAVLDLAERTLWGEGGAPVPWYRSMVTSGCGRLRRKHALALADFADQCEGLSSVHICT